MHFQILKENYVSHIFQLFCCCFQISGTAAKLGRDTAYHHCTVLVDVNECVLHDALNSKAVRKK